MKASPEKEIAHLKRQLASERLNAVNLRRRISTLEVALKSVEEKTNET